MNELAPRRSFIRRIDLATLDLFVLVCQTGSLGAAAKQGQFTVSAVSKRIKELEDAAQAPLLTRHARGVQPTAAGDCLLRHARAVLLDMEHLRVDLNEFAKGVRGYVHVYTSASAVEQFLAGEIAGFAQTNQEISIDLSEVTSREVIPAVRNGLADLGICDTTDSTHDLQRLPYRVEQFVVVVPKGHPLSKKKTICYEETLEYEQVGLHGSSMIQGLLENAARASGLILKQRIKVASLSALCRMIESRLGIGIMPKGVLNQMPHLNLVHAISLTDNWATRDLYIYAKQFDMLPYAAKRFVDFLTDVTQQRETAEVGHR